MIFTGSGTKPDPDYDWNATPSTPTPTRTLTGSLPDGTPVLVTYWPDEGAGELAFKSGEDPWARWGVPVELSEEPSDGAA